MYSCDDRIRVVRLYIQYDKSAAAVIQEAAMAAKGKYADVREKIRQALDESSNRYGCRRIHAAG